MKFMEGLNLALGIAAVVVPLFLACFAALWTLFKTMVHAPLKEAVTKVNDLHLKIVGIEVSHETRITNTESRLDDHSQQLVNLRDRFN